MAAFYAEDLAYIHHAGFTDMAREAAPYLLKRLREAGIANGLVVDLGCGSGVWVAKLVAAGHRPIGILCPFRMQGACPARWQQSPGATSQARSSSR